MAQDVASHAPGDAGSVRWETRLHRLRARLVEAGLDAVLVSQPETRYYLSGYTGHDLPPRDSAGYLLVTLDQAWLLTDPRTVEQAEKEAAAYQVHVYQGSAQNVEGIVTLAGQAGAKRIGFEGVHLPYRVWHAVDQGLAGAAELVDAGGALDDLRAVKDAAEVAALRVAIDVLDDCFSHVVGLLRPGLTELEVAREVERYLADRADGPSFPSIVASGPNGSMPHAVPSDRKIQAGEGITIDIGALAAGYCSDMTRTVCLGEPRDPWLGEIHALVLDAQETAERRIRPGMTGQDGDAFSRQVIAQAGYGDFFTHSTGHGIGLEVHEPPWISAARGTALLEPGMVFSIEPGVYVPGRGGVRIEDLVLLDDSGAQVLCRSPKNLVV